MQHTGGRTILVGGLSWRLRFGFRLFILLGILLLRPRVILEPRGMTSIATKVRKSRQLPELLRWLDPLLRLFVPQLKLVCAVAIIDSKLVILVISPLTSTSTWRMLAVATIHDRGGGGTTIP